MATLSNVAYATASSDYIAKTIIVRLAGLLWKITEMTMMNKYIQQFLDDNDLQAGEKFYILDKDHEKISNELFYINENAKDPYDILKCTSINGIYLYNLLCLLIGIAFVKKIPYRPKVNDVYYCVTPERTIARSFFFSYQHIRLYVI